MRISDWSSDVCSSDLPMLVKVPRSLRYKRISPVLIETAKSRSPSRSKSAQLFDSEPGTLKSVGCTGVKAGSVVPAASPPAMPVDRDRKSVVSGKSVSVRVDLGGRRLIKKTNKKLR